MLCVVSLQQLEDLCFIHIHLFWFEMTDSTMSGYITYFLWNKMILG